MAIIGDFWTLSRARPSYAHIRDKGNTPSLPAAYSPCCVQLSVALTRYGDPIDGRVCPCRETFGPTPRYFTYDGIKCIIQVGEMYWYLKDKYGDPDNVRADEGGLRKWLGGRFGIISFGWEHIDLWADDGLADTSLPYKMSFLFGCESIRKRGLFFWEVVDADDSDFT